MEIKGFQAGGESALTIKATLRTSLSMRRVSMIILLALLIWLLPVQGARTYIVDDSGFANYQSIQQAVIAASDGDTIYIKPGEYNEEIVLNKSVTLMPLTGETGPIILKGAGLERGITITSDGCILEGLSLQNFAGPGIYVQSSGNVIRKNSIDSANPAVLVRASSKNLISDNDIRNCQGAVAIWDNASNNLVQSNVISDCNVSLFIREAGDDEILDNSVFNSNWGVWLESAGDCRIEGNDIDSKNYGLWLMNSSVIDILGNKVSIHSDPSATSSTSRGISLYNSSEVKMQSNNVLGAALGLGAFSSRNNYMTNNSIMGCTEGVILENCSASSLEKNTVENAVIGLDVGNSVMNSITNNIIRGVEDTAVQVIYSRNNSLLGNQIKDSSRGIILVESPSNRLSENVLDNVAWGLYAEAEAEEGYNNSVDETNTIDSMPIVYLFGRSGGEIKDRKISHLTMAYCKNVTIEETEITNDAVFLYNCQGNRILKNNISGCFGMRVLVSNGNDISDNRLEDNEYSGLFLYGSSLNQISGNNASRNNQFGISLLSCNNNSISDNLVQANADGGIWMNLSDANRFYQNVIRDSPWGITVMSSGENLFYHNDFINNQEHAEDSSSNYWDAGNVTGGNYWSGHTAKGNPSQGWPRIIKGGTTQDRYPFQDEGGWRNAASVEEPSAMAVAAGL